MTAAEFHHALRIMCCVTIDELHAHGVINDNWGTPQASDRNQVEAFMADPFRESLKMPDGNFERLWALVEMKLMRRAA